MDWGLLGRYQIGYVARPLPGDQRFTGALVIPYLSRNGGVVSVRFRNLISRQDGGYSGGKFAVHTGQKHRLYNTPALFEAAEIVGITEGEIDAIAATEQLGLPSVGVPGATNWDSALWKPIFSDFQQVVVLGDGDDAGRDFAKKVAEDLGWRAMIAVCPDGEDVSSMAAQGRGGELKALYSNRNQED